MNNEGVFRQKKVFFSQISNNVLRDTKMSLKGKGLYSIIQSYITIENFILYKTTLKKQCKEGNKAFESAWKELKDRGYLVQYRLRDKKGNFYYEYDLLDNVHTPEKGSADNAPSGKGGIYNKTDLTNIDFNNTEKERYTILSDDNNVCFKIYKDAYTKKFNKEHMKVSATNKLYIDRWVSSLAEAKVLICDYEEEVEKYFNKLPPTNNGNILAFIKTSKRLFDVDIVDSAI